MRFRLGDPIVRHPACTMRATHLQASNQLNVTARQATSSRQLLSPAKPCTQFKMAATATAPKQIAGLQQLIQERCYKAALLDQFGVLHDGRQPYPGVVDAIKQLAESGVRVFIISNSSRRVSGTLAKLEKMGYKSEWFAGAMTSGEVAYQHLATRPTEWWRTLGKRVLHITWSSRGTISLDGLNLEVVDAPEEAEFILTHGTEALATSWQGPKEMSMAQLQQLLARCAWCSRIRQERRDQPLTMVVANPDICTVDGDSLVDMPGALARVYKDLGGHVQLMGKPDPIIYEACLSSLGMQGQESQVLAIGDSLEHDIGGAMAAGIDALFVAGGIHASELQLQAAAGSTGGHTFDDDAFAQLCMQHNAWPQYVLPYLRW